ncbi:hypothetical protein H5410_056124 [Solanum commersonii]|uniref:Uncharacterized protein n=1 Tax=Solanum commersonii TaxID=4109 RepID=A0A9J5WM73_SOLCO|nr:hypothetical protein H5410_056124 [Solanum commersonii]
MDNEIQKLKSKASTSQQHDYKNAELRTSRQVSERQHKNINLNKLFEKPFTPKISKNLLITEPQTSTYADSLHHDKKNI